MPTPACDDADTIARRIIELRNDEMNMRNCLCRRPDDGGAIDASACPVHRDPEQRVVPDVPVGLINCGLMWR